jgi:cell wall-associated NlpC family hydrolase
MQLPHLHRLGLPRTLLTLLLALAAVPALTSGAAPAQGAVLARGAAPASAAVPASGAVPGIGLRAAAMAASRAGDPYVRGGAGPHGFDCSGLTQWAYARVGKHLPRTAAAQYRAAIRIPASQARPGDLVFFHSGGWVYHVAIYAGGGRVWHASRPGTRVSLVPIWTRQVTFGRVR